MLRMAVRFGVVRFFGRRAVPAMLAVDLLLLANRTRQVPIVDRNLRRGVAAARERLDGLDARQGWPIHGGRPDWRGRGRRPDG